MSHLLFADDCFLFCRANVVEAQQLLIILKTYEAASCQEINLSKSEIFFQSQYEWGGTGGFVTHYWSPTCDGYQKVFGITFDDW